MQLSAPVNVAAKIFDVDSATMLLPLEDMATPLQESVPVAIWAAQLMPASVDTYT